MKRKKIIYKPLIYFSKGKKIVVQKTINKCNNNCIFCVLPDCFSKFEKVAIPPTTSEFKKIIDSYSEDGMPPDTISFTTAEPTLRKDLINLLEYTKRKYPSAWISVLTNARMFSYKKYVGKFRELFGSIKLEIPIHGPNAEIHDGLTRVNGSFSQTVEGIRNIHSAYPKTSVNIRVLVHKANYKHLEKTMDFIKKNFSFINSIILIYISMIGNAKENSDRLLLKFKDLKVPLNNLLRKYVDKVHLSLFHFPYCIIDENFWNMNAGRTLAEEQIEFSAECPKCKMYNQCCGFWKSEFSKELFRDIKPIKDLPEEIKIELTNDCNLDCNFCFNDKENKKELSKKQIFSLIDEVKKEGIESIRFTGGEPFLREDLKDILRYSKEKGIYTILNTNGVLVDDGNIGILKYVDDILVSVHDFKDLNKKKELFEKLKKFDLTIRACTILTRENIKNLEKYYEFFSENPTDDWFLLRPVPNNKNKEPINRGDVKKFTEKMIKFNRKYNVKGYVANSVPFCAYEPEKIKDICVGGRNDNGYTRLVIDSEGNIKTDYFSKGILGKVQKDRIVDVWNSQFTEKMRNYELVPSKCEDCTYLGKCGGGLIFIDDINLDPILVS